MAGGTGDKMKLTIDDSYFFLKAVEERFEGEREKFTEFVKLMNDFKTRRIELSTLKARVKELFEGHRNLILIFNLFLPKGDEIPLPRKNEQPPEEKDTVFDELVIFATKIKARFQDEVPVYLSVSVILNMFKQGKTTNEIFQELKRILKNHPDVMKQFIEILSGATGTASMHSAGSSRNSDPDHDDGSGMKADDEDQRHDRGMERGNGRDGKDNEKANRDSEGNGN